MTVHFIGAGPGAPDLITVRGRDLLSRCPVCLFAGSLVPRELLAYCPDGARVVDTAPMSLDEIVAEIQRAHATQQDVARLHHGVSGAPLFLLFHEVDAPRLHGGANPFRFVTDNGKNVGDGNDLRGCCHHVTEQGFTRDLMQYLGKLRFQTRPFACSQDRDRKAIRVFGHLLKSLAEARASEAPMRIDQDASAGNKSCL